MTPSPPSSESAPLRDCGALVTGGSRGIGRAIVTRLAAAGAAVVFTYRTSAAAAEALVDEIREQGGRAHAVPCDLADSEQTAGAFEATTVTLADRFGIGLDIVVANAGIFTSAPLDGLDLSEWDHAMAVNARGTLLTLQFAARNLRDNGRIITISTIGTHWPSPGEAAYAASKAAAEQLTRVASRELGGRGITANVLALGPTDTDLLRSTAPPAALDATAAMTALGRIGGPADIAGMVALLAHQDSGWVTGQIIRADGGLT